MRLALLGDALTGPPVQAALQTLETVFKAKTDGTGAGRWCSKHFTRAGRGVSSRWRWRRRATRCPARRGRAATEQGNDVQQRASVRRAYQQPLSNGVVLTWSYPAYPSKPRHNESGLTLDIPGATSPYTNALD